MQSRAFCSFSGSRFLSPRFSFDRRNRNRRLCIDRKAFDSRVRRNDFYARRGVLRVCAMGDDMGISSFDNWGGSNESVEHMFSSSEGDNSDGEVILQPVSDVDLPTSKEEWLSRDDSLTVAAHRLGMLGRTRKKRKTVYGILNNVGKPRRCVGGKTRRSHLCPQQRNSKSNDQHSL